MRLDYRAYAACFAQFFGIQPLPGETIAIAGRVLRGAYAAISDAPSIDSHPAMMLVSADSVERGLMLEPYEVDSKTNASTALPALIAQLALQGVVFALDAISTQKNGADHRGNDDLGALQGNQSGLLESVATHCQPQQSIPQLHKGPGRIEKRTVRITHQVDGMIALPGLQTLIQVESQRQRYRANSLEVSTETRYYVASLSDTAQAFADRVRGYWGVENKVHSVRDVTQGEDASRLRTSPLVQSWALARNFALNLYRNNGFLNMAQAQRLAGFSLNTLKDLFRMK